MMTKMLKKRRASLFSLKLFFLTANIPFNFPPLILVFSFYRFRSDHRIIRKSLEANLTSVLRIAKYSIKSISYPLIGRHWRSRCCCGRLTGRHRRSGCCCSCGVCHGWLGRWCNGCSVGRNCICWWVRSRNRHRCGRCICLCVRVEDENGRVASSW